MAVQWGLLKPPDYINQGISSFSQGFLTPFIAGREKQQAEMQQMQVQKAKQLQEAQNRYAQTGDPKELMAVNPQMAMQIEEYVRTRPPEEMVKLAKATQYMNLARPYLNQESWKQSIRPTMIQLGAPEQMLPPENASPEQLHQFVWGSDIMGASLKNMGKAFKGGEFVQTPSGLQQVPPTEEQKAKAQKERAQAGFYEKKAEDPYYGKTPEYIKPVGQPGGIIPHAPGTPVPEGYEFASKKQDQAEK